MVLSRLELETYSYQKYTLPIKLKNRTSGAGCFAAPSIFFLDTSLRGRYYFYFFLLASLRQGEVEAD
jgi:hypothetical protein